MMPSCRAIVPKRVQCVAFENAKNQTVLLVNPTLCTPKQAVELRGLKGGAATPLFDRQNARYGRPQKSLTIGEGAAHWTLPPRSVCVLVAR